MVGRVVAATAAESVDTEGRVVGDVTDADIGTGTDFGVETVVAIAVEEVGGKADGSIGFNAVRSSKWCKRTALFRFICLVKREQCIQVSTTCPSKHSKQREWPSETAIFRLHDSQQ